MFCTGCGNEVGDNDKFCSACGAPVTQSGATAQGRASRETTGHNRRPQNNRTQSAQHERYGPNPESIEEFKRTIAKKAKLKRWILWPIAAVIGTVCLVSACLRDYDAALWAGIIALIPFIYGLTRVHLSAAQYNALPGSSTESGKPRCVHCGHVGLYTHGEYKTDTKYHDCSKCGVTLYTT